MSQYYKDITSKLICEFYVSPGKISTIFFSFWNVTDCSKACIESKSVRIALQPLRKYGRFSPSVIRTVILLQIFNRSIEQWSTWFQSASLWTCLHRISPGELVLTWSRDLYVSTWIPGDPDMQPYLGNADVDVKDTLTKRTRNKHTVWSGKLTDKVLERNGSWKIGGVAFLA